MYGHEISTFKNIKAVTPAPTPTTAPIRAAITNVRRDALPVKR
jgi:hypothetical protein